MNFGSSLISGRGLPPSSRIFIIKSEFWNCFHLNLRFACFSHPNDCIFLSLLGFLDAVRGVEMRRILDVFQSYIEGWNFLLKLVMWE